MEEEITAVEVMCRVHERDNGDAETLLFDSPAERKNTHTARITTHGTRQELGTSSPPFRAFGGTPGDASLLFAPRPTHARLWVQILLLPAAPPTGGEGVELYVAVLSCVAFAAAFALGGEGRAHCVVLEMLFW